MRQVHVDVALRDKMFLPLGTAIFLVLANLFVMYACFTYNISTHWTVGAFVLVQLPFWWLSALDSKEITLSEVMYHLDALDLDEEKEDEA